MFIFLAAADLFEAYKQQYCSDQVNALKQAFNSGNLLLLTAQWNCLQTYFIVDI